MTVTSDSLSASGSVLDNLATVPDAIMDEVLERMTSTERAVVTDLLNNVEASREILDGLSLLPHQRTPKSDDWLLGWLLLGGRGAGKTLAAAVAMIQHVQGPPCHDRIPGGHRMLIVGPSQLDAVDSCVQGPSGLLSLDPTARLLTRREGTLVEWPSGAVARVSGAFTPADVESLRSKGNNCFVWMEEVAAWRMLGDGGRPDPAGNRNAMVHIRLGLRVGPHPRFVASTTPKPRKEVKRLMEDGMVRVSHATTADNPHLPAHIRSDLEDRFGGTRLGRQELNAEMLDDIEGALWSVENIERDRLNPAIPEIADALAVLARRGVAVGVDPPGGATECGIVGVSLVRGGDCPCEPHLDLDPRLPHLLVERDKSIQAPPPIWAATAALLYHSMRADTLAAEVNYGGDMVVSTMATADASVPVEIVRATRGKAVRAQPMATMSEQGRVHMVGYFPELEDELTGWDPFDGQAESPNRLDAMVWAGTQLLGSLGTRTPGGSATPSNARPIKRSTSLGRSAADPRSEGAVFGGSGLAVPQRSGNTRGLNRVPTVIR